MNELQAASENPKWELEEELKKYWPSAVEGDFEHPEKEPSTIGLGNSAENCGSFHLSAAAC